MSETRLTSDEVHKIARLSRLALTDEQVALYRSQLSAVLEYMNRLRQVDLTGVEPLTHGASGDAGAANRLDHDTPGPTLPTDTLMSMAPGKWPPFVKVPKVLDEGGGGGGGGA